MVECLTLTLNLTLLWKLGSIITQLLWWHGRPQKYIRGGGATPKRALHKGKRPLPPPHIETPLPIEKKFPLTLSDPGYFRQLTIRGGGALKDPPPLRSRKLLCPSSPYHTCEFYQVFLA